jgi:hypothetical protein
MAEPLQLALELLVANVAHGTVALTWALGLRRFAGPLTINLWTDLLALSLVLPALLAAWRLLGLPAPPPEWRLLRAELWARELVGWGLGFSGVLLALVGGTTVLFLVQEAIPAWRWRRGRLSGTQHRDARLDAALARVLEAYARAGQRLQRGRPPRARVL